MSLRLTAVALLLAAILGACSGTPSGVISPSKMALLLADLHEAEAVVDQSAGTFRSDSLRLALKQSVFAHNGVTADQVDTSFAWYGRHIDKYNEVCDMTIAELQKRLDRNRLENDADGHAPARTDFFVSADGDSVDIWNDVTLRNMSPLMSSQIISFDFRADNNWEPGDNYTLRFKLNNTAAGSVRATLVAEYPDGTMNYATAIARNDAWHRLTLHLNAEKRASSLYGVITPEFADSKIPVAVSPIQIDSISLVRQRHNAKGVARQQQFTFRSR